MNLDRIKKIIKEKIKYYFFSDFIKDYFKSKTFHPNPQANWIGEILKDEVSKKDKSFFEKSSLDSRILTVNGITKTVGIIKEYAKIDISEIDTTKEKIQFSIYAKFWEKNSTLKIVINNEEYEFKNVKNIDNPIFTDEIWFDLSLNIKQEIKFLEIFCKNEKIYFAKPITFNTKLNSSFSKSVQPNHIIILVLDGVVAEFLTDKNSNFCDNKNISPNINNFFKDCFSTKFAFSTCEWTLPGISSFFSGMYTSEHKLSKPQNYNYYNSELPSLPEILNENGYKTQLFSTGNRTTPLFGFQRGFERTFFSHPYGITKSKFNTNDWINNLIDFLNIYKNDKTFSYLHFPNTHQDWMVPNFNNYSFTLLRNDLLGLDLNKIEEKDAINIEKLRIYELDLFLDSLFNFINKNISENTTVILTGDHGSPFVKKYTKKAELRKIDDETPTLNFRRTNVPFFCRSPKYKQKNDNYKNQLVSSNIDLSKTILDICEIENSKFKNSVSIFDENKRKHLISESIYKDLLEIAVIKNDHSYFERYEFDHRNFLVKNNIAKKMFYLTKNNNDKNLINDLDTKEYELIAKNHIKSNFNI